MKKLICMSVILCFFVTNIVAQDTHKKHEVRAGISDALPLTIGDGLLHGFSSALSSVTGYSQKTFNEKHNVMWGLGYKYHFNHRFSVGVDIGILNSSKDTEFTKANDTYIVHRKTSFILVLPTGQYNYLSREKVQLYGNLGVGLLSYSVDESKDDGTTSGDNYAGFAFQLNPVGVRVGKQFAGYAELGFGFKGIVNIGASIKF